MIIYDSEEETETNETWVQAKNNLIDRKRHESLDECKDLISR